MPFNAFLGYSTKFTVPAGSLEEDPAEYLSLIVTFWKI
jgi:hypothetical protein